MILSRNAAAGDQERVTVVGDGVALVERNDVVETRKGAIVADHHVPAVRTR